VIKSNGEIGKNCPTSKLWKVAENDLPSVLDRFFHDLQTTNTSPTLVVVATLVI
jgi:hypothetical protein